MAGAAIAATIISSLVAAGGAVMGGIQQSQQAHAQASLYEYNSKVNQQNATIAQEQAAYQATQQRRQLMLTIGSQQAAYGAAGVDVNSGTPLDLLADTTAQGELQAASSVYSGIINANNYLSQSSVDQAKGAMSNQAANNYLVNGVVGATGTLLGGAVQSFKINQSYKQNQSSIQQDPFNSGISQ